MNYNNKIYELIQTSPRELEIKSYTIKYSNCDFIHTENIVSGTRRIFERKKLNKFKQFDKYDYIDNEITFGYTTNKELAEIQLKIIQSIYTIQSIEYELADIAQTKDYYNSELRQAEHDLRFNKLKYQVLNS